MVSRLLGTSLAFRPARALANAASAIHLPSLPLAGALAILIALGPTGCDRGTEATPTSAPTSAASEQAPTGDGFVLVDLNVEPVPLSQLLEREAKRAEEKGLRLYVEFGAKWCVPCQKLRKAMKDEPVASALKGAYIVAIDVDAWGGRLGEAGFTVGAIPVIFELDAAGLPTDRRIDGRAFGDDDPARIATAMRDFIHKH